MRLKHDEKVELEIKSIEVGWMWPVFTLIDYVLLPASSFNISLIKRIKQ